MIWKKLVVGLVLLFCTVLGFGQQITVQNFSTAAYGNGASISVPVGLTGCFGLTNKFNMYLSDATGSFASPQLIGSYNGFFTPFVNGIIPTGTAPGANYKIRITSTAPAVSVETVAFPIAATAASPVANLVTSPSNVINDSTFGRCLIFGNQVLNLLSTVPAGHTMSAQVRDSLGNPVAATVTATQIQFTMVPGNYYYLKIQIQNTLDNSISTKSFLIYVSNNNLSLQTSGASDACLPDTKTYTVNVVGNGGIRTNYPGTKYSITWGDGATDTYTHCEMIARKGEMKHDYINTSCGQPPITDLSPTQYNAFRVNVLANNVFCPNSFTSITTYAKVWQKPIADFINPLFWCINVPVTFQNTSQAGLSGYNNVVNCIDVAVYEWYVDGVLQFNAPRDLTYTFTTPGYHTIKLIAVNDPCSDEEEKVICIEQPISPNFNINGADSIAGCAPLQVDIDNKTVIGSNPCRPLPWLWTVLRRPGMTPAVEGVDYTISPDNTATNPSFIFLLPGDYYIRLTVLNSCGNFSKDLPVTITDVANVTFPTPLVKYCGLRTIDFSLPPHRPLFSSNGGNETFNWTITGGSFSFRNGTNASSKYPVIQFNTIGTYTVGVDFNNPCGTQSATQTIVFDAAVDATASNDTTLCYSVNSLQLNSTASGPLVSAGWSIVNGTGSFSNASIPNPVYTFSTADKIAGTVRLRYIVYSTTGSACGNDTATVVITIRPDNAVTSRPDTTICSGANLSYTPTSNTPSTVFTWTSSVTSGSVTGNSASGSGPINHTLVNPSNSVVGVVTYYITPSDPNCTGNVFQFTVTVQPVPTLTITPATDTLCTGGTTNINLSSSYTGALYTYTATVLSGAVSGWSNQSTPSTNNLINQVLINNGTVPAVLQYTVSVFTSGVQCPGQIKTITVVIYPTATIANAGADQLLCNATTAILAGNQPTVGIGTWVQTAGPAVTIASPNLYNTAINGLTGNNTYKFVWTITGIAPCAATSDTMVIVNRPLVTVANAGIDIVSCDFTTGTASVNLAANATSHAFETGVWTIIAPFPAGGNPVIANPNDPLSSFTFSTYGNYTLVWSMSNDAGCPPTTDTVVVRVFQAPNAGVITPPLSTICRGEDVNLAVGPVTGNIVKWQYNTAPFSDNIWVDTLITTSTISFNNIQDTMLVRAIVRSSGFTFGCTSTDTSELALINVTPPSIGGNTNSDSTVCSGNNGANILLTNHRGAVVRWESSVNNGISWVAINNTTTTLTYSNLTTTTWYRAIVQNGTCGPAISDTTIITVRPLVSPASAGIDQLICGTTTILNGNAPAADETGLWIQVSGPNTAVISSATTATTNVSSLLAGTYRFVWTLSNSVCPSESDTVVVVVRPPVTIANAGTDVVVCEFETTAMITLAANNNPTRPFESGAWSIISQPTTGNGTFSDITNPLSTFSFNAVGTYTLAWRISNDAGCTPFIDTVVVYVFEKPKAGPITGVTNVCAGANINVTMNTWTGVIAKWQYNPAPVNDNVWIDTLVNTNSINFLNVQDSFAVRVIVRSTGFAFGCTIADTSNVLVINVDPPTVPGKTATSATVCSGANGAAIALTGNVGAVLRWEYSTNSGASWVTINNTTNTNNYLNLTTTTWYRAIVQSGLCNMAISDTTIITVVPKVQQALAGNDQLICGTTTTLQSNAPVAGETGTWSQLSGPNTATLSSTIGTTITASGLIGGTYQFVWTLSNIACPASADTVVVVVRPPITTANAGNDIVVCDLVNTATITLAANANPARPFETGTWTLVSQPTGSTPTFGNINNATSSFTLNRPGTYKLVWTITNDAGCPSTNDTLVVYAFRKPVAGPISGNTNLCAGSDVIVTMSSWTGVIKKWQYNTAPISDNIWIDTIMSSGSIALYGLNDSLAIRVIVESDGVAFGCNSTDTSNVLLINVAPGSVPGSTGPNATVCSGNNSGVVNLTGHIGAVTRWEFSTNNGGVWSPINNTTSVLNYTNLTVTTWYRAVVESATCGQVRSTTTVITVVPAVTIANAGPDQTTCANNVALQANAAAPSENGAWTQVGGPTTATLSSSTSASITVSGLVPGTYQFVWTLSNGGCPATRDTVLVNMRPATTSASAGPDVVICDFVSSSFITLQGNNNPARPFEYSNWSIISQPPNAVATFSSITDPQAIFSYNVAGTYMLQYTISNDAGCAPTRDTLVINVFDKPVAGPITANTQICAGSDVVVTLNSYIGVIKKWQYNPAPVNDNIWIDTLVTNPVISFLNVQDTMAVRVIVVSGGSAMGCNSADTSNVLVIRVAPSTIPGTTAANDTICSGLNGGIITLSGNVGNIVGWQTSTTSGNSWVSVANTSNTLQYANLTATTWFRALIESANCGVVPSSITIITVVDTITQPNAGADILLCNSTQTVLSANAVALGETGLWSQVGGAPIVFSANNIPTVTVSNLLPGTYTFVWTIANGVCPPRRDTVVVINYQPLVNITDTASRTICFGQSVMVSGQQPTGGNGTYTYQWQLSTNASSWVNISGQTNQSLSFIPTGSIYVRRIVISGPCQSISLTTYILVQPPVANNVIASNQNICINTAAALITGSVPTGATGLYNYQWQESTDSGRTWFNIPGANGQNYQPGILNVNTHYRRNVSSGQCVASASNYSDSVFVKINPNAQASFSFSKDTSCPVFVLDTSIITNNHSLANGGYLWYANNSLLGTSQTFPGYSIINSGDNVVIRLVAVSAFGCLSDTMEHTFYAKMKPTPSLTVSDSVGCGPLTVLFTNNTPNPAFYQFQWNFGNGQVSNAYNPGNVVFMPNPTRADTVYYVSLTVFSECDSVIIWQSIRVKARPRSSFSPDTTFGCSPFTVNFANLSTGGTSYTWDFDDGTVINTSSTSSMQHTFTTTVRDTFVVKLIARNQCGADTSRFSVIVSPNAIGLFVTINGTDNAGCNPHAVRFYNNSFGGSSYVWNFGDGNTLTTALSMDTVVHVYNQPGVYTIQIRGINSCSEAVTTKTITVHGRPIVDFTATPAEVCVGENVTFLNRSDTLTGSWWNFGDGATSSLTNAVHAYNAAGLYTITLIGSRLYASGNTCLDSARKQVRVIDSRPGLFTVSDSVSRCVPFTVTFTNQVLPSALTTWNFGDGGRDTGNIVSHTFTEVGTFAVTMNAQAPGGCKYAAIKDITVTGPAGSMNYESGVICGLRPIRFETISSGTDSVKWNFGDGTSLITTSNVIFHTYTNPGNYVPSATLITGNGGTCRRLLPGIDTIKVERLNAGFTAALLRECGQTKVQFTDTTRSFFGVQQWSWNFGDGSTSNVRNPLHVYTSANNWPVQLITRSAVGCLDTANLVLDVPVNNNPQARIISDSIVCANMPINFQSSVVSQDSISMYLWSFSNNTTFSGPSAFTSFSSAGAQTARLVVSTINGCRDTTLRTLTVNPSPVVRANGGRMICKGQPVLLSATGASSYSWSNTSTLSCNNCPNPIALTPVTTTYEVSGSNAFGCISRDTTQVVVAQPFKIRASPNDTVCVGESMELLAEGADYYRWAPSATLNRNDIPNPIATPTVRTVYRVVGYDSANCFTDTSLVILTVGKVPTVSLGADRVVAAGTLYPLVTTVTNGPIVKWVWTSGQNVSCTNCPQPIAHIKNDIAYSVRVTNNFGCEASDTIKFKVFCEQSQVYIPNLFTPDGDGVNDVLMVRGQGIKSVKNFRIFNRWGEIVFERANFEPNVKSSGWDGTIRGQKAPPDVYVYTCEVLCENDIPFIYKGNVAIIK